MHAVLNIEALRRKPMMRSLLEALIAGSVTHESAAALLYGVSLESMSERRALSARMSITKLVSRTRAILCAAFGGEWVFHAGGSWYLTKEMIPMESEAQQIVPIDAAKKPGADVGRFDEVMRFVRKFKADYGEAPGVADVASAVGMSRGTFGMMIARIFRYQRELGIAYFEEMGIAPPDPKPADEQGGVRGGSARSAPSRSPSRPPRRSRVWIRASSSQMSSAGWIRSTPSSLRASSRRRPS